MEWIIGIVTTLFGVLLTLWLTQRQERSGTRDAEARDDFKTLWPKLSASLKKDLEQSLASLTEARLTATGGHTYPMNLAHFPDTSFYNLHLSTISGYDKTFGRAIKDYLDAAVSLKEVKHAYNQLAYADAKDEAGISQARQKMYAAAIKLENLIDHSLRPQIERYDDLLQKDS